MKIPAALTVPLLTLSLSVGACGQTINHVQDTRRPVGDAIAPLPPQPASTEGTKHGPEMESQPMPSDRIEKPTPLDDELQAIRAAVPDFNSVIVRDAATPADYPTLPPMTLKNVSLGQFLQFIQAAYPGLQCVRIDGPAGSLYSIRINSQNNNIQHNHVRLYRLSDIINGLAQESAAKDEAGKDASDKDASAKDAPAKDDNSGKTHDQRVKEATADVLSLLQAALDQTDQDGPSSLKIHEPTLTLMFKGSQAKQEVLEEALSTLSPRTPFFAGRPFRTGFSGGNSGFSFTSPSVSVNPEGDYINLSKAIIDQTNAAADQYKESTDQLKQLEDQRNQLQSQLEQLRAQMAKSEAESKAKSQDNK